jgi:hypothetical protein
MKPIRSTGSLRVRLCAAALAALLAPASVTAQAFQSADTTGPARLHAGLAAAVAQPLGEFADYVGVGGGLEGFFRVALDERGIVSLRLQAGFLNYGSETKRVCLSQTVGCRIQVDLSTWNNIVLGGLGPEIAVPVGRVRLYGNATAGFGYFSTYSSVEGTSTEEPFASTTNYEDGGFAWTAGGGIAVLVASPKGVPISIDLGVSRHSNGRREYLTEGGITDLPDGSIVLDVNRSRADLLLWRIGVSVGIRQPTQ